MNLAVNLLHDAHKNLFDMAIVVSDDTDLVEAIRMVRHELKKGVGLLSPRQRKSIELRQHATFQWPIRERLLAASQFPSTLTDKDGTFHKPASW